MAKKQTGLTTFWVLIIVCVGLGLIFSFKMARVSLMVEQISKITPMFSPKDTNYQTAYYQDKIKQFAQNPGSKQDIFLVGDSLTDLGNWTELLNKTNIKNRGIIRDTTIGVFNRIDEIIDAQPQTIFIMIGVNDLWNENRTIDEIIFTYKEILTTLENKTPETQIYIQSLLPINKRDYPIKIDNQDIREFNQKLEALAKEFNYEYMDIYANFLDEFNQLKSIYTNDGVHLTAEGYKVWAKAIAQVMKE